MAITTESLLRRLQLRQSSRRGHQSDTEPWIVGHSLLIAHATVAKLYMKEYKPTQKGIIGITLNGDWTEPYDDSPESEFKSNLLIRYQSCPK